MTLQTLALALLTLVPAHAATNKPFALLRQLDDGRVVDYRGLLQLHAIEMQNAATNAERARTGRRAYLDANDEAIQTKQHHLWLAAHDRYHIVGKISSIGANGVYIERRHGLVYSPARTTFRYGEQSIFVANYPDKHLVDGDPVDTWAYPTGPHRFVNAFHQQVTIPGFDYGQPFTRDTNTLLFLVRLLPAGETNLPIISKHETSRKSR